ncbi:hypothetical protein RF11_14182 [Thelohanellus kitauei]|uniref:CCHC-type domain-containing protein n=1 Tax=Thelohanellus kitauei TaxID=669202 RepID=A0A0C2NE53_THEKT|nr:hypothetical protein RF11_14182 [Thelohanellus kitauei]
MATKDDSDPFARFYDFHFAEFDNKREDWVNYIGRFHLKLKVQGFRESAPGSNEFKRDLLLGSLSPKDYQMIRERMGGDTDRCTFEQLCDAMSAVYEKKRNPFVERREFYKCIRRPDEDVQEFVSRLRTAASHCSYGEHMNEMLRDQFIMGLNDNDIQEELLSRFVDLNHSLNEAVEVAGLLFNSRRGARSLSSNTSEVIHSEGERAEIMKIAGRFKKPNACLRCGQEGFHQKYEDCPALKAKCNACGKIGHYAKMCLSKGNSNRLKYSDKFSKYYSLRLWLNTLRHKTKPIQIKVNINGQSTTSLSTKDFGLL